MMAILIGMRWFLIAVSVDLSLQMSNAEHLFVCLLAFCISSFKPQISIVRVKSMNFVLNEQCLFQYLMNVLWVQPHVACHRTVWRGLWARNSDFIWKTSQPTRWWTCASKNHLLWVRWAFSEGEQWSVFTEYKITLSHGEENSKEKREQYR